MINLQLSASCYIPEISETSQFFSYQNVCISDVLDILVSFKYQLARTYLRSLKWIDLIQVPVRMSLSCIELFSLTKVLFSYIATTSWMGQFYLGSSKRSNNVSNRIVSLMYQLRPRDDASACSATSQTMWDQNKVPLRCRIPSGKW